MRSHAKAIVAASALLLTLAIGVSFASAAAPIATIDPASEIGVTSAKATGEVDPSSAETSYRFEFITDAQFQDNLGNGQPGFQGATEVGNNSLPGGGGATPVAATLEGLSPATTYHLRLLAENADGSSQSIAPNFETDAATAPVLSINPAANIKFTEAQISGEVDPEGGNSNPVGGAISIFWQLQFSRVDEPGNWQLAESGTIEGAAAESDPAPGAGIPVPSAPVNLTNLSPGTEYAFRLLANYAGSLEATSSEGTFTTLAVTPPVVTIAAPAGVDADSADLSGTVDPTGTDPTFNSEWHFEYATKADFSDAQWAGGGTVSGNVATEVKAEATNLKPNTTYFLRLVASNAGGSSTSSLDPSFTTDAVPPTVTALSANGVGTESARLRGRLNPNGSATSYWFEWGTADCASNPCTALPAGKDGEAGDGHAEIKVSQELEELEAGTTYHFRLVADNGTGGEIAGADATFTTTPATDCANAGAPGVGTLPDCRAYEMVSPPDKNGGDVMGNTTRTRAAADGDAVGFASLGGFGDAIGTGVSADYLSVRGAERWQTHSIMPPNPGTPAQSNTGLVQPMYLGDYTDDLSSGVFHSWAPQTEDPNVAQVPNLYRRDDLRTPGAGSYDLLTACPLCAEPGEAPLPALAPDNTGPYFFAHRFAAASPDLTRVVFESRLRLTSDAPGQPALCKPATPNPFGVFCPVMTYEWHDGEVSLVGILPNGEAADVSIPGQGVEAQLPPRTSYAPHVVSDGSDGHTRVFFTQPTDANGKTSSDLDPVSEPNAVYFLSTSTTGKLFMRLDNTTTVQLNSSERTVPGTFAPAEYLDASADGTRVFFMSGEALTDDATGRGIYMYDASKPDSAPDNLTLMTPDNEPADNGNAVGMIGASDDGHYAYLLVSGGLVAGDPAFSTQFYLWHDGELTRIGPAPDSDALREQMGAGVNWILVNKQSRVTPDGRHLLFSTVDGAAYGNDHGICEQNLSGKAGCRELYLYDTDTDTVECVSCDPQGVPPNGMPGAGMASVQGYAGLPGVGGSRTSTHTSHALTDDGSRVFFNTEEALVPEDTNGVIDAYRYDAETNSVALLSSGTDKSGSWFLDANRDGSDVFFMTRERLSGWDVDSNYDLYDARIGGGLPEPVPTTAPCAGDACRPPQTPAPPQSSPASSALVGPGNPTTTRKCPKGRRPVRAGKGKPTRCVKKRGKRAANANRRASR